MGEAAQTVRLTKSAGALEGIANSDGTGGVFDTPIHPAEGMDCFGPSRAEPCQPIHPTSPNQTTQSTTRQQPGAGPFT